jgi:hypothetical protein
LACRSERRWERREHGGGCENPSDRGEYARIERRHRERSCDERRANGAERAAASYVVTANTPATARINDSAARVLTIHEFNRKGACARET